MWIFTKHGFFSVTQHPARRDNIQIRARSRQHLQNLRDRFPDMAETPIHETPTADYRFRMVVRRGRWERLARHLTEEIDYCNFKNEAQAAGQSWPMLDCLHRIWSIMHGFQQRECSTTQYRDMQGTPIDDVPDDWDDAPDDDPPVEQPGTPLVDVFSDRDTGSTFDGHSCDYCGVPEGGDIELTSPSWADGAWICRDCATLHRPADAGGAGIA